MPRNETIITIFVASPRDVSDERDVLEDVVEKVNRTHARRVGIRLELLRWEEDVIPAFGDDPQTVINDQIPQDYDIFIGIFWHTIGTPTGRAMSGTVEEFDLAKARHERDPNEVEIMLYFKTGPTLSLDEIDPEQLKNVRDFKASVSEQAVYSEFATTADFANQVRAHLEKYIFDWAGERKPETPPHESEPNQTETECCNQSNGRTDEGWDEGWDEGVLEMEEEFENEMNALNAVLNRMASAVTDVGGDMSKRTKELESLQSVGANVIPSYQEQRRLRAASKRIMKDTADDMNRFVTRMKDDLPLYRQHLDKGLGTLLKAIPIYLEIYDQEKSKELKENISRMLRATDGTLQSMENFHGSVRQFPRMTTPLVRSKRETEKVLQEVIDISRGGKSSLETALALID